MTTYREEDEETGESKELFALLVSNRTDEKATTIVEGYKKRGSIELFFRNAKQELGLAHCHSTNEHHIHAHLNLLFVAESLIRVAQWEHNEKKDTKERLTHGQVVALLFHIRCEVFAKRKDDIHLYFDTTAKRFTSFIHAYWSPDFSMVWFPMPVNWNDYPASG